MKNKIRATITATQPRIATGQDDSAETLFAIITDANEELRVVEQTRWKAEWEGHATHHGLIRVKHPAIMAGTWEETRGDMARLVFNWLEERDLVRENDFGIRFLRTPPPATLDRLRHADDEITIPLPPGSRNHLAAPCPECGGPLESREAGNAPGAVGCTKCGWTGTHTGTLEPWQMEKGGAVARFRPDGG